MFIALDMNIGMGVNMQTNEGMIAAGMWKNSGYEAFLAEGHSDIDFEEGDVFDE